LTITCENNNTVIVYALGTIISLARNNHYISVPQSVWWLPSILRSHQGLVNLMDNLHTRATIAQISSLPRDIDIQFSTKVFPHQDQVLQSAERCPEQSIPGRKESTSDSLRRTQHGRLNPLTQVNLS
jgi:hypothetical protein